MLFVVSVICLASSIYYYNTNKNFNYFVKNQKQFIINNCKKFNTNIYYCLGEDLDDSLGEYMKNENLRDRWIDGVKKTTNNQKNSQNLETIIEINEDSDTSDNKSISSDDSYDDDEYHIVNKTENFLNQIEETHSDKPSNFWPFW